MSVWSVTTRRAPSFFCRDARVCGHTTTAMHEIEYTPRVRWLQGWINHAVQCREPLVPPLPRPCPAQYNSLARLVTGTRFDSAFIHSNFFILLHVPLLLLLSYQRAATMQPVVTGQTPTTLEWKIHLRKNETKQKTGKKKHTHTHN